MSLKRYRLKAKFLSRHGRRFIFNTNYWLTNDQWKGYYPEMKIGVLLDKVFVSATPTIDEHGNQMIEYIEELKIRPL